MTIKTEPRRLVRRTITEEYFEGDCPTPAQAETAVPSSDGTAAVEELRPAQAPATTTIECECAPVADGED